MEQLLQKRNTDCVYFLASPLTCKKGMDCEYRHNEIARHNPRDCWYWLAGNCINPTCAFRHPPLDGHRPEAAPPESAPFPYESSRPMNNKTSVPCYFYFSGFCNKGDSCSFLHDPDGGAAGGKSLKTTSASADELLSENKTSTGNVGIAPAKTHPTLLENASKPAVDRRVQSKYDLLQSSPKIMPSSLPHMFVTEDEEAVIVEFPTEGFIRTRSHLFINRISDELVDDHIEPEDQWESSPGFDVFVDNDDRSENLGYEDDTDYILATSREHEEVNCHFAGYDVEDPVEYDLMYPDTKFLYQHNACDDFDGIDNEHILDNLRKPPNYARKRMLDSISSRKRKFLTKKSFNDHSSIDLRDCLRKRVVVDGNPIIHSSRRHESTRVVSQSQERPRRHAMSQRLCGRLASQVGKSYMKLQKNNGTFSNSANWREWYMHSHSSRSRQHYKEKRLTKRHSHSSEVPRKLVSRESRSTQTSSTTFAGPKTLAEIKDEKKKAEEHGECFEKVGCLSSTAAEFQGPKSLSEILKEKKRLGTETESNARSC